MPIASDIVLIIEDEPLIAMAIEAVVEQAGLVAHTSRELDEALDFSARVELRGAVLDYWIGKTDTRELAELLRARAVPFILLIGSDPLIESGPFSDVPILRKPYSDQNLLEYIQAFGDHGQA